MTSVAHPPTVTPAAGAEQGIDVTRGHTPDEEHGQAYWKKNQRRAEVRLFQDEQERELPLSTPARFVSDPRSVTKYTIVSSLPFSKLSLYSCGVFVLLTDARMLDKRALPMQGVLLS